MTMKTTTKVLLAGSTAIGLAMTAAPGFAQTVNGATIQCGPNGGADNNVDCAGAITGDLVGNTTGSHVGAVTGTVTGNVTGALSGNSTGTHTGDVTGNLTGNSTGVHTGAVTG